LCAPKVIFEVNFRKYLLAFVHLRDCSCAPILSFFSLRRHMAPQQSAKFITAFLVNFLLVWTQKDSVANYASIWTLLSPSVMGPDLLCNALNILQCSQDSVLCGGNFPKRKKSAAELCQILRRVTTFVLNSTHVQQHMRVTISCRYCIAFEMMHLFLVSLLCPRP